MAYFITFIPWIIFWSLSGVAGYRWAIIFAAGGAIAINIRGLVQRDLKVLELGTLAFFLIMVVLDFLIDPVKLGHWMPVLGSSALFLITLVSILIRQPFTIQYARKTVPKEYWTQPLFLSINYHITWVWLGSFFVHALCGLGLIFTPDQKLWLVLVIPLTSFLAAVKFTTWYPDYAKARYFKALGLPMPADLGPKSGE